jgi:hypothetical protein
MAGHFDTTFGEGRRADSIYLRFYIPRRGLTYIGYISFPFVLLVLIVCLGMEFTPEEFYSESDDGTR